MFAGTGLSAELVVEDHLFSLRERLGDESASPGELSDSANATEANEIMN